MTKPHLPGDYVPVLAELPKEPFLVDIAKVVLRGEDPSNHISSFAREQRDRFGDFIFDPSFGAIPIGRGAAQETGENPDAYLDADGAQQFLVSGWVAVGAEHPPEHLFDKKNKAQCPLYANPSVGGLLDPCLPTCGTSQAVGIAPSGVDPRPLPANIKKIPDLLKVPALGSALNGSGVAIAIVDSGINMARLEHLLDEIMFPKRTVYLDKQRSWKPPTLVTEPGGHRVGHGTMCAYDALIAAPNATLIDVPMLLVRDAGDHHTTGTVAAATLAFQHLLQMWTSGTTRPFKGLVVSNSWGIFHPSLEDYPQGSNSRFIDNAAHPFRGLVVALTTVGVDVVFCGNNCGGDSNCAGTCASGTCLGKTDRMIMGANAYPEVLTIGGCDANDRMVGYSSSGPVIANMFPNGDNREHKPDLVAYTHFLGSKAVTCWVPDTGVSAACPTAAGCVAALRTNVDWNPQRVPPATLFQTLRDTARRPVGATTPPGQWDADYGFGIVDPLAAANALRVAFP